MIRTMMIGLVLAAAVPAAAQGPLVAAAETPADPDRLAAARPVVEKIWPLGTYRRMMGETMTKMMDGMMASMFDMRAADLAGMADSSGKAGKDVGANSLGEIAQNADPHFRERMKITMETMMGEMIPLLEKMEPAIQDSLTSIYARRFDAKQLSDMNIFFATPSGRAYADQAMLLFMDPEMMKNMAGFAPELMKAMPTIMKKVETAIAHLPPLPKAKDDDAN